MTEPQSKDPLHGVTLEMMLTRLVEHDGWEEMGRKIKIRCFNFDPSIKSSLRFLRKTPWARAKVEDLYLKLIRVPLAIDKSLRQKVRHNLCQSRGTPVPS